MINENIVSLGRTAMLIYVFLGEANDGLRGLLVVTIDTRQTGTLDLQHWLTLAVALCRFTIV